ncbi:tyrosine-type recombinase/integrase, partial [Candidatus Woesearchaeota archaeon]|nr:tyrosine-type recombinase/integrase [Candidatus Woesearchaeota archaeon]
MIDKKEGESNKNTRARSKPKYNVYYLPIEEINQIITAAKNLKERVVLKLLARTGIRRFELCQILVQHVDFKNKSVYIPHGKGDVPRSVPVDEDTLQDIQFYIGSRQHGKLIQSNNKDSDGIDESRINIMVKNSAIRAGIKNPDPTKKYVNPHIFRHSLIRHLLKEKMPMNMIQQIAGHSDARITLQMYSIP